MTSVAVTAETEVSRVQAKFIAALQEKGMQHTMEWVTGGYDDLAAARVRDEMANALGAFIDDDEARELWLTDQLESAASRVSNRSTSAGHELSKDSYVSALAHELERVGRVARRERRNAVRQRLVAAE